MTFLPYYKYGYKLYKYIFYLALGGAKRLGDAKKEVHKAEAERIKAEVERIKKKKRNDNTMGGKLF